MSRFALDTSTLGCFLRAEGAVVERLLSTSPRRVAVPAVVAYEMRRGLAREQRPALSKIFEGMLRAATILEFDALAAERAWEIEQALAAARTPLALQDVLAAATAQRHGCTLVTRLTGPYSSVPGMLMEDWY